MRALISQTVAATRPAHGAPWLPGLAHVLGAATTLPVFGGAACAVGLLMTSLVSFVVWLPLTALALNGGAPLAEDAAAPDLTPNARRTLFVLFVGTAWLAASITR
jgi:hypothetical protein